jgi:hypothetical protein
MGHARRLVLVHSRTPGYCDGIVTDKHPVVLLSLLLSLVLVVPLDACSLSVVF